MKMAYVAFDRNGRRTANTVEAAGPSAAAEMLRHQGLFVTRISEGERSPGPAPPRRGGTSRRLKNTAMLMRQMEALVSCGTPVVQALLAMERQARQGPWRAAVADVRARVEEGSPLSAALQTHPEYFDPICCSLVAAGESSGKLPAMLNRIAAMARKQLHIRKTIAGAMIYPAALLCIALGVLAVLLLLVIPRFGELFVSLDAPLPPTTAAMVALSRLVRTYWWLGLLGVAGPAVGLWLWLPTPQARKVIETVLLRLPQVGRIARSLATARVARVLGVLLESHLDAVDALRLARQSAGNHHYAALLAKAEDAIISGQPMSLAFCESDLISPSVSEAIRSGEQSGQVAPLLLNAADFLDEENELVVRSLVSLVEPAVLLLMGLVVGVVAVSMFMPLFDLTSMTQGGK